MFDWSRDGSRRGFLQGASRHSLLAWLGWPQAESRAESRAGEPAPSPSSAGVYDLSWTAQLNGATDRAIVDMPMPSDIALQIATRVLDNCDAAYGVGKHRARVVLNVRTRAVPVALTDAMWVKYALGRDTGIKGRDGTAATISERNPFLEVPDGQDPAYGAVNALVRRAGVVLVCDLAMGHLATRLAGRLQLSRDDVHRELAANLVTGAYLVPSGMYGLTKAQNLGCAYVPGGG